MIITKKSLSLLLALCVLGIAVLGFFAMAHSNGHSPSSCIGAVAGANCPLATISLADIASHISAVQNLVLAMFNPILTSLLVVVLLLLILRLLLRNGFVFSTSAHPVLFSRPIKSASYLRLQRWLSLLEERDPSRTH